MSAAEIRVDIYGNPVDWTPTGRRFVGSDGHLRGELRRGEAVMWALCRPHVDCAECAVPRRHDGCPVTQCLAGVP